MARLTFELPSLLAAAAGGRGELVLEVAPRGEGQPTLRDALEALFDELPALRGLLLDERGAFREHVLCFHNGRSTRWMSGLGGPVADGDTVRLLQAVSGG